MASAIIPARYWERLTIRQSPAVWKTRAAGSAIRAAYTGSPCRSTCHARSYRRTAVPSRSPVASLVATACRRAATAAARSPVAAQTRPSTRYARASCPGRSARRACRATACRARSRARSGWPALTASQAACPSAAPRYGASTAVFVSACSISVPVSAVAPSPQRVNASALASSSCRWSGPATRRATTSARSSRAARSRCTWASAAPALSNTGRARAARYATCPSWAAPASGCPSNWRWAYQRTDSNIRNGVGAVPPSARSTSDLASSAASRSAGTPSSPDRTTAAASASNAPVNTESRRNAACSPGESRS